MMNLAVKFTFLNDVVPIKWIPKFILKVKKALKKSIKYGIFNNYHLGLQDDKKVIVIEFGM